MSTEVVQELCRNLENVLHERLTVIQDILKSTKQTVSSEAPSLVPRLQSLEDQFQSLNEYTMGQVRTLAYNHDMLENRVESLESALRSAVVSFQTINDTIGMLQKRVDDIPVEAVEAQAELEDAQEAALNADVDASVVETKAKEALTKAVDELEVEEEEEVVEEEVEVEEEEEEEEEEVEEEELELEEFEYKKKTYYRDQNNNVYIADEDGCVDPNMIVGIWNVKTKKIDRVSSP